MAKRREIQECDFAFKCPKQWDGLREGEDPDQRYCETCERDVYFVSSRIELDVARKLGRCVAAEVDDQVYAIGGIQPWSGSTTASHIYLIGSDEDAVETVVAILDQQKKDRRAKKRDEKESR